MALIMDPVRDARRIRIALVAMMMLAAAPIAAEAQDATAVPADALRAAFVYNFIKLVSWPEGRFSKAADPVRVCTLADDPVQSSLARELNGKRVGARPVQVQAAAIGATRACHVIFLGAAMESRYEELMSRVSGPGVLLIDEGQAFTWPSGMIRLFSDDARMRFELNLAAVEQAGFKVDPRLIRLARIATR